MKHWQRREIFTNFMLANEPPALQTSKNHEASTISDRTEILERK